MAILNRQPRTAARRAASRANGRQGRGPKTPAGKKMSSQNALTRGQRAQPAVRPLWQAMATLGEDPSRYQALLRETVGAFPPRNGLELRLCQDITRLLLMAERNQQAQEAKLVRTFEKLEISRQKQQRQAESRASYDALQSEVLEKGLRRAPDSPAKFSEALACLERLQARAERGDCADETELDALYGKDPTFRGAGIINAFRALAAEPDDCDLRASLRQMIREETRNVAEEYQIYFQEHVAISRAMRLECLAPAADREYVWLQRQESMIDRRLDRKIKLLLALRAGTRRQADDPREAAGDEEHGVIEAPLGWIDSAAGPGPSAAPPHHAVGTARGRQTRTGEARDLSLRHKMGTPRERQTKDTWSETVGKIQSIYGLTPEPPNGAARSQAPDAAQPAEDRAHKSGDGSVSDSRVECVRESGEEVASEAKTR